ncbi:hypothetical protein KC19_12G141300 [Ceratodon purpureus]|uniref:Uncharacterized protein n=1 Tax=Ceratodon purpureus TaxID=3225 RepID=A0A8T0G7V0_CERPU|nr:hypothetical protein KC19_12G141300 [Ceratodon purpureus]
MGPKGRGKPFGQPVAEAPVVVDASGSAHNRRSKPSFHEWKLFMSSRASDVVAEAGPRREKPDEGDVEHTAEFKNILKEVEELGTSTLEWKDRKKLETAKLVALGSKAPKSFKMPVSMGVGMKRKREERAEQKRQDDIAQGIRSAKRSASEKKIPPRRTAEDRELNASVGKFKGGVLYVTPPSAPETKFSMKSKGEDRFFEGGMGKGGGGKKGGKKGKGGKKKGGKKKGKR